jgi:predicted DCC family thiol-disulfide oxidoreductase YuxK
MTTDWMIYNEPCPHCGGVEFLEKSVQEHIVNLEKRDAEEGQVLFVDYVMGDIVVRDTDVKEVWCRGCDTQVL